MPVGGGEHRLAAAGDAVWVTANFAGRAALSRIDPDTNRVAATISFPGERAGPVAIGYGAVWVVLVNREFSAASLVRHSFDELALSDGAVWVLALKGLDRPGDLIRVDAKSGRLDGRIAAEALNVGGGPGGLWITGCTRCGEYRDGYFAQEVSTEAMRPTGPRIGLDHIAAGPLFVGRESVWLSGYHASETVVLRLDAHTGKVERLLSAGAFLHTATALDRRHAAVWIARAAPPSLMRVDLAARS